MQAAKAKTRLHICVGWSESWLLANAIYAEPKIRELVFYILLIKDMKSKSILGVTSMYYLQYVGQMSCMCCCTLRSHGGHSHY